MKKKGNEEKRALEESDLRGWFWEIGIPPTSEEKEDVWPPFLMKWVLDNSPLNYSEKEREIQRGLLVVAMEINWDRT